MLRRSAAAVTTGIVVIVLPYLLAGAACVPAGAASGCCGSPRPPPSRSSRASRAYPQVTASYTPTDGYFPLAPWAGFAVLCGYAALALALASTCCAGGTHEQRTDRAAGTAGQPLGQAAQTARGDAPAARRRAEPARGAARGVDQAAHAPGTPWLLLAIVVADRGGQHRGRRGRHAARPAAAAVDPAKLSLTGIDLGQAVVAILAVLVISSEYSTGMIRITLTAMPRRVTVLAAKAAILSRPGAGGRDHRRGRLAAGRAR